MVACCSLANAEEGSGASDSDSDGGSDGGNGEKQRVGGQAYSSTSVPPRIDDPPPGYLEDADGRDSGEEQAYTGLDDYQLKDGFRDDDKKRWAATDFVRWLAAGATLRATGQVHDSHDASTSQVSSSAWGAEFVDVEVTEEEGEVGEITAENRISFSYSYTISGPRILDAKVLLSGACVDIDGKLHSFSLSDVRSESVTEHFGVQRMHVQRRSDSAKVSAGAQAKSGTTGASGSAGWSGTFEATQESEDGVTINTSINRALPGAGGVTDSEKAVVVEDEETGKTVLKKSYMVFSQGSVTLAARGREGSTTVVLLRSFKIENALKVFKTAGDLREPTDIEPTPGGGAGTPGENEDGGAGGECSDSPDGDAPDSDAPDSDAPDNHSPDNDAPDNHSPDHDSGAETDESSTGNPDGGSTDSSSTNASGSGDQCSVHLDGVEGLEGLDLRVTSIAPFGLAAEPGHMTGELHLILNQPAPRDLVFSFIADPPGSVLLLQGSTLTIPEGSRFGGGALDAMETGPSSISVHLLDASGALSGREAVLNLDCVSTAVRDAPELYACEGESPGQARQVGIDTTIVALRGLQVPPLVIGRTGFAAYDTTATTVAITVHDPEGVLMGLPSFVTIDAGEAETSLALALQDAEGTARLTLQAGDSEIDVYVVSRTQGWQSLPVIRIPLGATAVVPFELRWPERTGRAIHASSVDGSIAQPLDGTESVVLVAGAKLGASMVRGDRIGRTEIRYESEGLPDLIAVVDVIPARVRVVDGQLQIANLPAGTEGTIALALPDGITFTEIAVPPEADSFLSVSGVGTDRVVLRLTPSPDVPELLALGLQIDGLQVDPAADGGLAVACPIDVDEALREDIAVPVRNTYRIKSGS